MGLRVVRRGAALSLSTSPFLPCEVSFRPKVGKPSPAWLEGHALLLARHVLRPGKPLSSGLSVGQRAGAQETEQPASEARASGSGRL